MKLLKIPTHNEKYKEGRWKMDGCLFKLSSAKEK